MKLSSKNLQDRLRKKFEKRQNPHTILMGEQEIDINEDDANSEKNETAPKNEEVETPTPQKPANKKEDKKEDKASTTTRSGSRRRDSAKKGKFKRRGDKFTDLHTQQSFYVNNHIYKAMEMILAWGEKTYFVNEAFKQLILSDEDCVALLKEEDPQLLEEIKKL